MFRDLQDWQAFAHLEFRLETTESALSEHHLGEKQCTGEKTGEPHRRGGAVKKGEAGNRVTTVRKGAPRREGM